MGLLNKPNEKIIHHESLILWKKNCLLCGHVSTNDICDDCKGTARAYFDRLIEYLDENPKASFIEVYGNTSIPFRIIKAFVDLEWMDLVLEDEETRERAIGVINAARM